MIRVRFVVVGSGVAGVTNSLGPERDPPSLPAWVPVPCRTRLPSEGPLLSWCATANPIWWWVPAGAVGESVGHLRIDRIRNRGVVARRQPLIKTPRFAGVTRTASGCPPALARACQRPHRPRGGTIHKKLLAPRRCHLYTVRRAGRARKPREMQAANCSIHPRMPWCYAPFLYWARGAGAACLLVALLAGVPPPNGRCARPMSRTLQAELSRAPRVRSARAHPGGGCPGRARPKAARRLRNPRLTCW